MDEEGNAVGGPVDLLAHQPPNAKWEDGFRPVDVDFDACGRLILTSDGTRGNGSKVVRIEWVDDPSGSPTVVGSEQPTNKQSPTPSTVAVPSSSPTPVSSARSLRHTKSSTLFAFAMLLIMIYACL